MTKMECLQAKALKATDFRGHDMGDFVNHPWRSDVSYAHCKKCDKQVVVDCSPPPNGIDIGGEAVALSCSSPSRFS